jgi:hypothetical protein
MTCIKFTFNPPTQSSTIRRDENPYEKLHPVVQQYQKALPTPDLQGNPFQQYYPTTKMTQQKNASLSYKNIHDPFPSLVRPRVLNQIEAQVEG